MNLTRIDRSPFARWWWTVDRTSLIAVLVLMGIGLMLAFAASPTATGNALSAGNFSYAFKQVIFALTALCILIGASLLNARQALALAAIVFMLAVIGAGLALFVGPNIKGAHRWLELGGFNVEPSEFLKPAFAVLSASFLADKVKHGFPGNTATLVLLGVAIPILYFQPDVGQTVLLTILCVAMLFFAGLQFYWVMALGGGGVLLAVSAYFFHPHVRDRIIEFLNASGYQTQLARSAFEAGGIFGVGPGDGTIKYKLPDAHTDFIFAVAGEEFGVMFCVGVAALFGIITIRLLMRASRSRELFSQLAGAGLALVIGLQAFINMGVSLSVLPAKGMTLPLISYGGSSLFAIALTLGMALGLTRQRPMLPEELQQ